jgi:hypothetical protein
LLAQRLESLFRDVEANGPAAIELMPGRSRPNELLAQGL